jgi:AraC-like DNA-binding protein
MRRHRALASHPIERARMLLQGSVHRPISLPLLAKAVGLSPSHLCREFARLHGETPIAYLTRLRLETAMILRQDGQLPLASIAGRVGYASAAALRHALKRGGHSLNINRRGQGGQGGAG